MHGNEPKYAAYVAILKEELVPAMGCTEPISVAYAAARAREVLGCKPDSVLVECSESIIKNVKSVIVPNTGGLKGLEAAAAAGVIAGEAEKKLEVISAVQPSRLPEIQAYLEEAKIKAAHLKSAHVFYIRVTVAKGTETAVVQITDTHTHITHVEKNGRVLEEQSSAGESVAAPSVSDRTLLNAADIYDFAESVDLRDVEEVLDAQIRYNMAIAKEGMTHPYGANVGKTLMHFHGGETASAEIKARAMAAAASDARMNGCSLPVVINSGSGNQGITVSVPVIVYAQEMNIPRERLLRALVLANLVAVQQKYCIGTLSAFCGAVCAGVAAGAGIAFLLGEDLTTVAHTIVNALAILPGMVCDGAKPSCAAKISQAVEAGIFGYQMYKNGQQFYAGDGLIVKGVDANVKVVGKLGCEGMRDTNQKIIGLMLGEALESTLKKV